MMYDLQLSHNSAPILPQEQQGWGAIDESSLSIIVFFTYCMGFQLIILLVLVIIRKTICQMSQGESGGYHGPQTKRRFTNRG